MNYLIRQLNREKIFDKIEPDLKPVLEYLSIQVEPIKEYDLLRFIDKNLPDFFVSLGNATGLYRKHFYLFNRLYSLKSQLSHDGYHLQISALLIQISKAGCSTTDLAEPDFLQAYYLNPQNLYLSDEQIVKLQSQFWEKYLAFNQQSEALQTLGLDKVASLTPEKLKKRYNELAQIHHPDKGGDSKTFIQIKTAFKQLKLIVH
ncbi:DNA-J related domain-containing protein [Aliikangiella maris]|uniref:DNA-J related domain-containing protein n=2 Tax=Aliikangiella maris TaxID=3162458 RepID=A0ABV3MPE3_9GAMM